MANAEGASLFRSASWLPCFVGSMLLAGLLAGCNGPERQAAVPEHLTEQVTLLGIPNARFWGDSESHAIGEEVMQALARERLGRSLVAKAGSAAALDLVRKVMLASASVPGVFPPVLIDVEAGRHYQEMHVDGAVVTKTFLVPPQIGMLVDLKQESLARDRRAYVIFNARLDPEWASVDRHTLSIAGRAIATMIRSGGYNDVLRIYSTSQRNGIDYNLAYIDGKFAIERKQLFDPGYMRPLFDYGYQQGRDGHAWHKAPPILAEPGG